LSGYRRAHGEREGNDRGQHRDPQPTNTNRVQPAERNASRIVAGERIEWAADGVA
jgi:hypothetical protein